MICPHCQQASKIKNTSGPGRKLGAYAQTPEGTDLEIPAEIEIPQCICGAYILDPKLADALQTFEKGKVGMAFPVL